MKRPADILLAIGFIDHTQAKSVLVMGLPDGSLQWLKGATRESKWGKFRTIHADGGASFVVLIGDDSVLLSKVANPELKYFRPNAPDQVSYHTESLDVTDMTTLHGLLSNATKSAGFIVDPASLPILKQEFLAERDYGLTPDQSTARNHMAVVLLPIERRQYKAEKASPR